MRDRDEIENRAASVPEISSEGASDWMENLSLVSAENGNDQVELWTAGTSGYDGSSIRRVLTIIGLITRISLTMQILGGFWVNLTPGLMSCDSPSLLFINCLLRKTSLGGAWGPR